MKYRATTLLLLAVLALPFATQAMSMKKILRKHAQVMGGLEQWQQLNSYRLVFKKSEQRQLIITCRMPDQITLDFQNNGQLIQTEVYQNINTNPDLEKAVFDPYRL